MVRFEPRPWTPPPAPPLEGPFATNTLLAAAELWDTGGRGPEDVAVSPDGAVYTGLEDGRILRYPPQGGAPAVVARTGGRPLGVEFLDDGAIVVCDAHRGLLRITDAGEVTVLADAFEGEPFLFTNNASVAPDGTIYFTVSSRRYPIEVYVDDLLEHSGTGRLFALRPDGSLERLRDGLQFANGVALDGDATCLFVAETGSYRVDRLWLRGDRAGEFEVFADNLPGFPDNLTFGEGVLWVAAPSPRQRAVDALMPHPRLRKVVYRLPASLKPRPVRHGMVLGLAPDGSVRHNLQDASGRVAITTSARLHDGRLFVGSLTEPSIAVLDLEKAAG